MRRKILFLVISVITVLIMAGSLSLKQTQGWLGDIQRVKKAPDFTLSDLNGTTFHLTDFRGKVILVDFWATWCPYCRASIPILVSLYNDYKKKGLEVLGIAVEYDKGETLKAFVEGNDITYPVLIGNEKLAKEYSVLGLPTRFLINRQGEIVERFVGFQERKVLEKIIEDILLKE